MPTCLAVRHISSRKDQSICKSWWCAHFRRISSRNNLIRCVILSYLRTMTHFFVAHIALLVTVGSLGLLCVLAWMIVHVAGEELRNAGSQFEHIAPLCRKFVIDIGSVLWGVWCWLYPVRWKLKAWSLNKFTNSVIGVLLGASIYFVFEFLMDIGRYLIVSDEASPRRSFFRGVVGSLPHLHTPLWLELTALVLALVLVVHHWNEWRSRVKRFEVPGIVESCLLELDRLRTPGTNQCTLKAASTFLDFVMTKMKVQLEDDGNRRVEFSLMKLDDAGALVIAYFFPSDSSIQGNLKLRIGEGGAGVAFKHKNAIYVPSTTHKMGINVDTNRTIGPIYKPDETPTPIRSVFCVPVFRNGEVAGVLNVVSTERSAFNALQLRICKLTGAIVSMIG